MRVIVIDNPKGGCGKTTLSTNLAAFYARWGYHPIILDADAQRSSSDWRLARSSGLPTVTVTPTVPGLLVQRLERARGHEAARTLLIVDLPAAFPSEIELEILSRSDLVLLPMLASAIDTRAMVHHVFELYRRYFDGEQGSNMALIANRIRPHVRLQRESLDGFLQRLRFPLIGELRETINYPAAASEGRGIVDLPARRVIKDLVQWRAILQWVNSRLWPDETLSIDDLLG